MMRILPYELYQYTPKLALMALRKEFGMYDYCLNINPNNKAMQKFLDLGRNYFNLSFAKWVMEMKKRDYYVNTFHLCYAENNSFILEPTDFFLILECCVQWDIKEFEPFETNFSWYEISKTFISQSNQAVNNFTHDDYKKIQQWYLNRFMSPNKNGKLKPHQLDIVEAINYFRSYFN